MIRRLSAIAILAVAGMVGCSEAEDDGIKVVKVTWHDHR